MTLPDSDADPSSSTYHVQIGEGKGIVIGNHAHVVQQFYGVPAEPQVDLIAAEEGERFLRALLADHSSFMRNLLDNFVGREKELADIRQRIVEKQQTGGYVTITGQAGQGKSSIIARLVDTYQQEGGREKIAFHFIPPNPGPDHQVVLLRNLMARLILKYHLSDLYVASESRPALCDYFPKVLGELAAQGSQEVIFIDGLDQLEAEYSGERDLSFLPNNPPPGVVFVLVTRPNDTLKPLELLKPRSEYQLPVLSLEDFEGILHHRNVQLERGLAGRFYVAMQGNALYLDLLAKELAEQGTTDPEVLIKQVADNPEHLFSLTIVRLKRQPGEWREVIKPVLGVLLVAQEPLGVQHIRQILGVDDDRLREGMERLGGLIVRDWHQRYSLFHLKLYEYLRQDEQRSDKEYIFASDEEEGWHKRVAAWCEQENLATIWQNVKHDALEQRRREYARQHYVAHLYQAHEWQRLFEVLDTVKYGKARIGDDFSAHSYVQDLNLGQQAASWEGWTPEERIALLPRLWRYTLLRSSLISRANQYPLAAFRLLILLGRKQEAVGLAELLTDPANKVQALVQITKQLWEQSNQEKEGLALLLRAGEIARTMPNSNEQVRALAALATALGQAQQWEQAQTVWEQAQAAIATLPHYSRAEALAALATALGQAQQWEQAQTVIATLPDDERRAKALAALATAFAQAQQWEQAQTIWEQAQAVIDMMPNDERRERTLAALARAFAQAQQWEQAQTVIGRLQGSGCQAGALVALATAFAQAQQWEQAQILWEQALAIIDTKPNSPEPEWVFRAVATALAQAQQWEQAQTVIDTLRYSHEREEALMALAIAFAQAQQWEQAQTVWEQAQIVINRRENDDWREEALAALAIALALAQQWEQAQIFIDTLPNGDWRAEALAALATALGQAQRWEQAQTVIDTLENYYWRVRALMALATALGQAQRWEQAQTIIATIPNDEGRKQALMALATALGQAQRWEQAQTVIDTMPNDYSRAKALVALAIALALAQQWEQAQTVIDTIPKGDWRKQALMALATVLARTQQWEQAQIFIDMLPNGDWRAEALAALATALGQAQQWEQAQTVFYRPGGNGDWQAEALMALATALARTQQWEQAQTVWEQAQAIIDTMPNHYRPAEALAALATALGQAQQWEQAQAVIDTMPNGERRVEVLVALAREMAVAGEDEALLHVIHRSWRFADKREYALGLFPMVMGFLSRNPELGFALHEAFTWVDSFFLKG